MKRWARTAAFSIACAVVLGVLLAHTPVARLPQMARASILAPLVAAVVYVGWKLYYRQPKPFTETRRYARAMFASGIISMEELQEFYDTHPENEEEDATS